VVQCDEDSKFWRVAAQENTEVHPQLEGGTQARYKHRHEERYFQGQITNKTEYFPDKIAK
jgi:hypothetical protein